LHPQQHRTHNGRLPVSVGQPLNPGGKPALGSSCCSSANPRFQTKGVAHNSSANGLGLFHKHLLQAEGLLHSLVRAPPPRLRSGSCSASPRNAGPYRSKLR
jgi:hypothetical protein